MQLKHLTRPSRARGIALRLLLVAAVVGVSAISACGGSDDSGDSASASGASDSTREAIDDARLKFAECMRDNGVSDFPDPKPGEPGIFIGPGSSDADPQTMEDASDKCQSIIQDAIPADGDGGPSAAEREDTILKMTQCVRDKGFDIPDPQISTSGGRTLIKPGDQADAEKMEQLFQDPDFQDAMEECRKENGLPQPGEAGSPEGDS